MNALSDNRCYIWQYNENTDNIHRPMLTGMPASTDEDRAKIFGGNLGRLLNIDTSERKLKVNENLKHKGDFHGLR